MGIRSLGIRALCIRHDLQGHRIFLRMCMNHVYLVVNFLYKRCILMLQFVMWWIFNTLKFGFATFFLFDFYP